MQLLVLTILIAGALAAPMQQSLSVKDDGSYQFFYETGKDAGSHTRTEVRHPDGVVIGKFSYEDPNGDIREVSYRADDSGYVATGDVSVEGAPKGQFPAAIEDENVAPEALPEEDNPQNPEEQPADAPAEDTNPRQEEPKDEDPKAEDEIKDLVIDESSVNDPPEGFPQGFFLQHFQGLRRLPEPTKEDDLTTTTTPQPTTEEDSKESPAAEEDIGGQPLEEAKNGDSEDPAKKLANEMELFMHLRPFQSFAPQQMDSSMLHQPVYVFSYQHPDSYGYHYYF